MDLLLAGLGGVVLGALIAAAIFLYVLQKRTDRDLLERRIVILEELGWPHWAGSEQRWLLRKFPPGEIVF